MTAGPPRRLRLLRIDDDVHLQEADSFELDHLELVRVSALGGDQQGIPSWAGAIEFWKSYAPNFTVDLVVSDVKFIDGTSPLSRLSANAGFELPTGIGHFKPFAMMARIRGMPLGVAVHTADAGHWSNRADESNESLRAMSMLAAHDIGELAAILGEADELPQGGVEACWAWLRAKTADQNNHRAAIYVALQEYRKQLKSSQMLPSAWQALETWCRRMHEEARRNPEGVVLGADEGPGFTLLRADGTPETPISIISIFADAWIRNTDFVVERDRLPACCFELTAHGDFHALSGGKWPRIGALIMACSQPQDVLERALKILSQFPVPPNEPMGACLADVVEDRRDRASGLAVLLQDIRCARELFLTWENAYQEVPWDPETDSFSDQGKSLQGCALVVHKYLSGRQRPAKKQDVVDHMSTALRSENVDSAGASRCLALLIDLKLVEDESKNAYRATGAPFDPAQTPPLPKSPPQGFSELPALHSMFRGNKRSLRHPSSVLMQSFGLVGDENVGRPDNYNQIRRYVSYGFGLSSLSAGTKFIEDFRKGRADETLKAICRDYAVNSLHWLDRTTWPRSIR